MKERPILFAGEMVRAILDGRKTQTRRPMKVQYDWRNPVVGCSGVAVGLGGSGPDGGVKSPLGTIGDRLWVRETWRMDAYNIAAEHRASTSALMEHIAPWKPSIHMPRWASRISFEITAVRVERVQDITEEDAKKEGCDWSYWTWPNSTRPGQTSFSALWQSIYGTWDANPWVWVYEFRRIKP